MQKYIVLTCLLCLFFALVSMEKVVTINNLPSELLCKTVAQEVSKYPWKNFYAACQWRQICTLWNATLTNDALAHALDIPPMHYAAMMNNADNIIELKLAGHSPLALDKHEFCPLHYAVGCGHYESARILKIGQAVPKYLSVGLCEKKVQELTSLFTSAGDPHTSQDWVDAVEQNDYAKTITILSNDVDASVITVYRQLVEYAEAHNFYALIKLLYYFAQCAAEAFFFQIISEGKNVDEVYFEKFIHYKADPNAEDGSGFTLLHRIVDQRGLEQTLELLLRMKNLDINRVHAKAGCNAVHMCVHNNKLTYLQQILAAQQTKGMDVDITQKTKAEETLLHIAAYNNALKCLNFLITPLQNQINSRNQWGYSPLICAVIKKHFSCVTLFLQNGADVHIQDNFGQTALHFAASKNCPEAIELLIQHGADINCVTNHDVVIRDKDYSLFTPLHFAAYFKSIKALNLLLHYGADATLKSQEGKTAFELLVHRLMKDNNSNY